MLAHQSKNDLYFVLYYDLHRKYSNMLHKHSLKETKNSYIWGFSTLHTCLCVPAVGRVDPGASRQHQEQSGQKLRTTIRSRKIDSFVWCIVLCCAVQCGAVLCCAVLCWAEVCWDVMCCDCSDVVLCCAVLCCDVMCCVVLCCVVLCCVVLCCVVCCDVLFCVV